MVNLLLELAEVLLTEDLEVVIDNLEMPIIIIGTKVLAIIDNLGLQLGVAQLAEEEQQQDLDLDPRLAAVDLLMGHLRMAGVFNEGHPLVW